MTIITRSAFRGAGGSTQAYKDIGAILGSGGTDYAIIPLGDALHESADRTTVTTVGSGAGAGLIFTYSEARTAFDTATRYLSNRLQLPFVTFNGTDEEADSPDAAFWTRTLTAMSLGAWVNLTDATGSAILSKYRDDGAAHEEWTFQASSGDDLEFILYDTSEAENPTITTVTDTALSQDVWVFCVGTYDGTANATGLDLYVDQALAASTDVNNPGFLQMDDTAGTVKLGHRNATPGLLFDGQMAGGPLGPFFTQQKLNASQIARLFRIGKAARQ